MDSRRQAKRQGFTLLEVILSLTIGIVLLIGLYAALSLHLNSADVGRNQVDQATVTRAVLKKFTADVTSHLPILANPTDSKAAANSAANGSTGSTGGTGSGTGTTGTGSSSTDTTGTGTTGSSGTTGSTTTTTSSGPYPYNLGVQGGSDWCSIYVGKVPLSNYQIDANGNLLNPSTQPTDSDLRRIDYWFVYGDSSSSGLARQEIVMVTNQDNINNQPPAVSDEQNYIFAREVISVSFEYFDGQNWQTSWDGTVTGSDGVTPLGPPLAIAITISVRRSDVDTTDTSDPSVLTTRHVVHIPTAVINPSTAPQGANTTTSNSGTGNSTTSGSTTGQ
jgi:type II secretory pathway pseudopilin PulG